MEWERTTWEASCFGMKNGEVFSNSTQREDDARHLSQAVKMGCRTNPGEGHYICKASELKYFCVLTFMAGLVVSGPDEFKVSAVKE